MFILPVLSVKRQAWKQAIKNTKNIAQIDHIDIFNKQNFCSHPPVPVMNTNNMYQFLFWSKVTAQI